MSISTREINHLIDWKMRKAARKISKKTPGPHGGPRPNSGGKRPGSGRKSIPVKARRGTFAYYLRLDLAGGVERLALMSGHSKGEIVEQALCKFFESIGHEGFSDKPQPQPGNAPISGYLYRTRDG